MFTIWRWILKKQKKAAEFSGWEKMAPTINMKIIYCGGWGYKPKAEKLKTQIEGKFKGVATFKFTMEATPNISGFLEVYVNDQLIHSKKNGDGYVDTEAKVEKIFAAIQSVLAN